MKEKILRYILQKNKRFFQNELIGQHKCPRVVEPDLDELFIQNKHYFEILLAKDFIGQIPKDITEPALKVFEDHGEAFEKWILWQSYYVNRKVVRDPLKITFYDGMMVILKVFQIMAMVNKKTYDKSHQVSIPDKKVDEPWIDAVLKDIKQYNEDVKNKSNKSTDSENQKDS